MSGEMILEGERACYVHWCPFCCWSLTYGPSQSLADVELWLEDHLAGHVEEMVT